tara:strand:- start:929 stop:1516 length:588 start_codon:yes stop_codon:yes gene_type:complete
MNVMREYPDNYFDLAIVDPPYRDTNQPDQWMRENGSMKPLEGRPSEEYWEELLRVSKEHITWGANNFQLPQWKGFVFWRKTGISNDVHFSCGEVASLSEGLGTTCKVYDIATNSKGKIHPTQKPIKLYEWLYDSYAEKGQKILDTHLGSGSNAIAAHYAEMGEFVGVELDAGYFNAAKARIYEETKQVDMFSVAQ